MPAALSQVALGLSGKKNQQAPKGDVSVSLGVDLPKDVLILLSYFSTRKNKRIAKILTYNFPFCSAAP